MTDTHTALLREARDILAVYHSAITRYREIQGRRGGDTPTMANQIRSASIACSEQATWLLRKLDAALLAPAPEPAPPTERLTPSDAKFLAQSLVANGVYLATAPMIKKLLRIAAAAAEPASGVEQNAKRYEFIRAAENARGDGKNLVCEMWKVIMDIESTPEQMDAAIDAAMRQGSDHEG